MTVAVPQEPNKHQVQTHDMRVLPVVNVNRGSIRVTRRNEGVLPHNQFQSSTTVSVYGGVEVYNERSFCVKYRSQGVQTSFYESIPSASDSLGNTIPPGGIEDPGNVRADFPNASEERNLRNISRHSRVLFERIHGMQGIWRVASRYRLKTTEPLHRRCLLSHAHHNLVADYHQKKGLLVQNRSAGCVLSCTNTSTQQEVPSFCLQKQGISVLSTSLQSEHCPSGIYLPKT